MNIPNLENSTVFKYQSFWLPLLDTKRSFLLLFILFKNSVSEKHSFIIIKNIFDNLFECIIWPERVQWPITECAPISQQGFSIRKSWTEFPASSQLDNLFANDLGQIIYPFRVSVSSSVK